MREYNKPPLSIDEQIALLESRGMLIQNKEYATAFLRSINYYRLSGYFLTRYIPPQSSHKFYPDTTFEQVLDTYIFDRKLRVIVFDQIEKIEVALRSSFALHFSIHLGPWWYLDEQYYRHGAAERDKFCGVLNNNFKQSKEEFIKAFRDNYDRPQHNLEIDRCANPLPPWWMAVEILTITELSRLYSQLNRLNYSPGNTGRVANRVANDFALPDSRLTSWLKTISFLRNVCAHHGRLWNRSNPSQPSQPPWHQRWLLTPIPVGEQGLLYAGLCAIKHLLSQIAGNNSFATQLSDLFDEFPEIPKDYMGFPPNWKDEPLWSI